MKTNCDNRRVSLLNSRVSKKGPVLYIMFREQRCQDNWSLLFAQDTAHSINQSVIVAFFVVPTLNNCSSRQWQFIVEGLKEVEGNLSKKNIPFIFLINSSLKELQELISNKKIGAVVTDFSPLQEDLNWQRQLSDKLDIPLYRVDSHNIVPCAVASPKQEFAAYTIRPKIKKLLPSFMVEFPKLKKEKITVKIKEVNDWEKISLLRNNKLPTEKSFFPAGERAAQRTLKHFLEDKISSYDRDRNNPVMDGQSNLSPYIHFGQISAQRVALETEKVNVPGKESFLEELIIRKELSDNFCYYNRDYKNFNGFPNWAKETLNKHRKDKREYLYSLRQLENGETHDELWNASQMEMIKVGKMHGYMRMYWAKKILEWSYSPEKALESAIYLNDKYHLDGRDSRGYTGIAWSIGGVHDRAWGERSVFGKVRYMSYNGSKSKFKIKEYINKVNLM